MNLFRTEGLPPDSQQPFIPSLEEIQARPQIVLAEKLDQQRIQIERQIADLQAQQAALTERLASKPVDELNGNNHETDWKMQTDFTKSDEIYKSARAERSKEKILHALDKVGLEDGETLTAKYTRDIDLDLAGGYDEYHTLFLGYQAGAYLLAEQVTYSDNEITQRGLSPQGKKLVAHRDAILPLTVGTQGKYGTLHDIAITDTQPTEWVYEEGFVSRATEALRASRILTTVLPMLDGYDLQPVVHPNGYINPHELIAKRTVSPAPEIDLGISAHYDRDYAQKPEKGTVELASVTLALGISGQKTEQYVVDASTLEVRPHRYASYDGHGNKHLHVGAEALLSLATATLANMPDEV